MDQDNYKKAIDLAVNEIRSRKRPFHRGHNDCWALAQRYDYYLRGEETPFSSLSLEFNDLRSWKKALKLHGISSIEALAEFANYSIVSRKPRLGDLGFQRPMAILLVDSTQFWSLDEANKKIKFITRNPLELNHSLTVFEPRG